MSAKRTRKENGIWWRWVNGPGDKPVKRYEINYPDPKRRGRTKVETLRDGDGVLAAREIRARRLAGIMPADEADARAPSGAVTFAEMADSYIARKEKIPLKDTTLAMYRTHIRVALAPTFGDLPIADITADDVAAWVDAQRDGDGKRSPSTIKARWNVLNGIFKHARRRKAIAINPCEILETDERPPSTAGQEHRFLTQDEMHRVLAAAAARDAHKRLGASAKRGYMPWLEAYLQVALFTGLRIGEMRGLQWRDIDRAEGWIHVRRQINKLDKLSTLKTDAGARKVMLPPTLAHTLRQHQMASRSFGPRDPVFASKVGTPLAGRVISRNVAYAVKDAKIEGRVRVHDFRHTYASILITQQNANVVFVADQLGHAKTSTTLDVYADLFSAADHADRVRAGLDNSFGSLMGGSS